MTRAEDALQRSIVRYLRLTLPRAIIFAVPNGGARTRVEGAILKATGVLPGIPDLCILTSGGQSHWIELKTPKGRVSERQQDMHVKFATMGIPYCVARSLGDVEGAIKHWRLSE